MKFKDLIYDELRCTHAIFAMNEQISIDMRNKLYFISTPIINMTNPVMSAIDIELRHDS